jgi:hypothetical protein
VYVVAIQLPASQFAQTLSIDLNVQFCSSSEELLHCAARFRAQLFSERAAVIEALLATVASKWADGNSSAQ